MLAGLLAGHVPARQGLMEHAIEAGRDSAAAARSLSAQLVALDADRTRMVLPGLTDPRQAAGLASAWPAVALTLVAQDMDVLADCGRLDAGPGQPLAVLSAARLVAVVLRPTLRQVSAARPRIEILTELVGGTSGIALVLTGPGAHSRREVARALGVPSSGGAAGRRAQRGVALGWRGRPADLDIRLPAAVGECCGQGPA